MKSGSNDNDQQHWSQIQEAGAVYGIKLLFFIYRILGRPALILAMMPVILYFFAVRRTSRHASLDFLWRLHKYNPAALPQPTLWISFRHFYSFADCLVDKIAAWSDQINATDIKVNGHQQLKDLLAVGQGGVILASHLGNLEMCKVLAKINPKLKLSVLMHTKNAEKFNQLAKKIDPENNVQILQVSKFSAATAIMLNDKIMQGEFIAIAADRTPINLEQNTSQVTFLGEQTMFPEGPHLIAGLLRCPLFMVTCLKQQGHHHIYFETLDANPKLPRKERKQQLHTMVQNYANRLEHYCQLAPLQWFNFYMFWQINEQQNESNKK